MELQSYCDNVVIELTGWKAKMYDLVRKLDKMPTGVKEKVVPEVNQLHIIIEELGARINQLTRECPTEWNPQKTEISDKAAKFRSKLENVWQSISPSDVGG